MNWEREDSHETPDCTDCHPAGRPSHIRLRGAGAKHWLGTAPYLASVVSGLRRELGERARTAPREVSISAPCYLHAVLKKSAVGWPDDPRIDVLVGVVETGPPRPPVPQARSASPPAGLPPIGDGNPGRSRVRAASSMGQSLSVRRVLDKRHCRAQRFPGTRHPVQCVARRFQGNGTREVMPAPMWQPGDRDPAHSAVRVDGWIPRPEFRRRRLGENNV